MHEIWESTNELQPPKVPPTKSVQSGPVLCLLNAMKTLREVVVGDTVFRWFPEIFVPMELRVTAVSTNQIICNDWVFDRNTGAEIDEFLGWGPTRSGTFICATPARPEFN